MRIIDRSRLIFALLIYLPSTCYCLQVGDRFFLDDSIASELEDWEVRWLRDAVRRGRAFVSKGSVKGEEDDWESFARSIQAQNSRTSSQIARPIPASEPSFLGSFGGTGPVVSIGPPQSGGSSFAALPGVAPGKDNSAFFFGNFDTNSFMQPVVVQQPPPVQPQPIPHHHPAPAPRPFQRRITPAPSPPPSPTPPPSSRAPAHHATPRAEQTPPVDEGAEFNALDNILRQLISRRQKILDEEEGGDFPPPTTRSPFTTTPPKKRKSMRPLKNIITSPEEIAASWKNAERKKTTTLPPTLPGHPPNEWVMMNPDEGDPEREDSRIPDQLPLPTGLQEEFTPSPQLQQRDSFDQVEEMSSNLDTLHSSDPEEEQFRKLSTELAEIIKLMKKKKREPKVKKKPAKARVIVIRNGTAEGLANRQYNLVATITLIRDGGKNILVDTGLATDINGRTDMIRRLESLGVPTPAVHVVVSTHGHPDHAGNNHIFPDAVQYHGWYVHDRTVFNLSNLFDSDREQISPAVSLIRTPGHTSEDVSVLVRDAIDEWGTPLGNVAVSGDVFVRVEDIENDREWVPLSADVKSQALSRRTLLCKSDCIVPGHGPPFTVDAQLRARFKC